MPKRLCAFVALTLVLVLTAPALAGDDALPKSVLAQVKAPLVLMGSSTYRVLGFSIYRATFWTTNGVWDQQKPYALELRYMRSVSKDTLVDTVTSDLHDEKMADDATIARWHQILVDTLSDVVEGDTIVSLYVPGQKSPFFYNDKVIARIGDQDFIKAYFNIWLGLGADKDMRENLLGRS